MPTYEYECDKCRSVFEVRQRISEPALTTHEGCGGAIRRLLSAAPFILKGDGWYVTDYPSASRKKALDSEKSSKSDSKTETKSESKSEVKTESKADTTPKAESKPASTPSSGASST